MSHVYLALQILQIDSFSLKRKVYQTLEPAGFRNNHSVSLEGRPSWRSAMPQSQRAYSSSWIITLSLLGYNILGKFHQCLLIKSSMKQSSTAIKLHATYARSAGMYASQIWSTPLLIIDPFSNSSTCVESNHSSVIQPFFCFCLVSEDLLAAEALYMKLVKCLKSPIGSAVWSDFGMILSSLTTLFSELFFFLMFLWPNVVMLALSTYSLPFLLIDIPPHIICASRLDAPTSLSPFNVPSVVKSYANCLNNFCPLFQIILRISDLMMLLTADLLLTLIGLKKT